MVTLSLPFPPSVNSMFFNRTGKGRGRGLSKKYQEWKTEADAMFMQQRAKKTVGEPIKGHFTAFLVFDETRRRHNSDLDNRIKATLDFIQRAGLIENDSLLDKLDVSWGPVDGAFVRVFQVGVQ